MFDDVSLIINYIQLVHEEQQQKRVHYGYMYTWYFNRVLSLQ